LSDEDAKGLLKMANARKGVFLGNPKNGKACLQLTVKYKNRNLTWIQGDTHAVWLSHQSDVDRTAFESLWSQLKKGDRVSVEIIDAKFIEAFDKNKSKNKLDDLKIDLG
jgi:hypothetical protein